MTRLIGLSKNGRKILDATVKMRTHDTVDIDLKPIPPSFCPQDNKPVPLAGNPIWLIRLPPVGPGEPLSVRAEANDIIKRCSRCSVMIMHQNPSSNSHT